VPYRSGAGAPPPFPRVRVIFRMMIPDCLSLVYLRVETKGIARVSEENG
jgi:hypothetical protein